MRHFAFRTGPAGVLAWLALLAAPADAALPQAVVTEPVIDVGLVSKGEPITHEFVFRNEGDGDLEITEVKPACGCTVARYARRIGPGESGKVETVVDTSDFSGPIAKSIVVFTNDPASPRIVLVVKANIRAHIEVRPGYARFVVVQGEEYKSSRHLLRAADAAPFHILEVNIPVPFLVADFRRPETEEESAEGEWKLELTLDERAPLGSIADYVVVHTDHPQQKLVRIPVSGFVRPPMVVVPQEFDFGQRKLEEPYPGKIQVRVISSQPIQLGEASIDLEGVEVGVEEVEAGRLYNLLIRLQPDMEPGPASGFLVVSTDSRRYPRLRIPVKGTVL